MFLDTNIENYYITMVNPTTHARCLIRNKKEKNEEYYFLLASKRSWANVFYSLLEKYIKKKNNTEGILGYTVEPFHNGHLSSGTEESGRCREVQVIKS